VREYLDSDVAHAVRAGLAVGLARYDDPGEIASCGLTAAFFEARYDFALPAQ
jgi:hypothetical protein